jgi:hypothetical protein
LNDELGIGLEDFLPLLFALQATVLTLSRLLLLLAVWIEEVTVFHLATAHVYHFLYAGNLLQDKLPRVPKIITLISGKF